MHLRKVIIFGTFDILHPGHLDFFRQAKVLGNFLVVVVARDKNVLKIKGGLPRYNEQVRLKEIKTLERFKQRFSREILDNDGKFKEDKLSTNKVILGSLKDRYKILEKEKPDIIALGYDQKVNLKILQEKLKEYNIKNTKVIRLQPYYPEIYKSSKLK